MEPKVFISYSWTSQQYKDAVLDFATALINNHVNAILDQWDLKPGQDIYEFMESGIATSDKVLLLCDKEYKRKADDRKGGTGVETMIITPELFQSSGPHQNKFIPIYMGERTECAPRYIQSRLGIDLTKNYEEGFEQILHAVFDQPVKVKPKLGPPPVWFEERQQQLQEYQVQQETGGHGEQRDDDIETVKREIEEIYKMLVEADVYLRENRSDVTETINTEIQRFSQSSAAIKIGSRLPEIMQKTDPRKAIIGGLIAGTAYLGALAYDGVSNLVTEMKVKNIKSECYEKLVTKYELLVEKQNSLMVRIRQESEAEKQRLKVEFSEIHTLCSRIKLYLKTHN